MFFALSSPNYPPFEPTFRIDVGVKPIGIQVEPAEGALGGCKAPSNAGVRRGFFLGATLCSLGGFPRCTIREGSPEAHASIRHGKVEGVENLPIFLR
jgi:hypothetical protein